MGRWVGGFVSMCWCVCVCVVCVVLCCCVFEWLCVVCCVRQDKMELNRFVR